MQNIAPRNRLGQRHRAIGVVAARIARRFLHTMAFVLAGNGVAGAGPLEGKSYIIELSSSQSSSGYGAYLVPPLYEVMQKSGLRAANGPGADVVVNVVTEQDVGRWIGKGAGRAWIHTVEITVGISPESYVIPYEGTPVFGVTARLLTPNPDREDELACLIKLAARTALANYRPEGVFPTDGQSCLRK